MSVSLKKFTYRNKRILDAARDKPCQNCAADDGTIVAAHSNSSKHGKGKGIKSHDCFVAFLCYRCHSWLDQGTGKDPSGIWGEKEKPMMFSDAMHKTWLLLFREGVLR